MKKRELILKTLLTVGDIDIKYKNGNEQTPLMISFIMLSINRRPYFFLLLNYFINQAEVKKNLEEQLHESNIIPVKELENIIGDYFASSANLETIYELLIQKDKEGNSIFSHTNNFLMPEYSKEKFYIMLLKHEELKKLVDYIKEKDKLSH